MFNHGPIAFLSITIASPELIRLWSHGEVSTGKSPLPILQPDTNWGAIVIKHWRAHTASFCF
jgi:hypothetical protein